MIKEGALGKARLVSYYWTGLYSWGQKIYMIFLLMRCFK